MFASWRNLRGLKVNFLKDSLASEKLKKSTVVVTCSNSSAKYNALFQEIKGRQQIFMKAFNAGDAKGAAAVYDPDGYFMPNGRHPVKGRAGTN
ncbi:hypothetical protein NECAME_10925 [Necator americanus]|uniref:Uncharacterized protein n=1 Tax=Necator americanus TaxID=51031 RepID=W2T6G1_NECAM|nr:hypothetical protein NECAME_10925 [Necator americanus]ETN77600.1 hypothetical protein NECAME_10925 [Necator americanus]